MAKFIKCNNKIYELDDNIFDNKPNSINLDLILAVNKVDDAMGHKIEFYCPINSTCYYWFYEDIESRNRDYNRIINNEI